MVCSEMICREFEGEHSTSAALERIPVMLQKMPPTDEHAVEEQRVDGERA